ncbi:MAG: phosphoglycerate mutase family protein [Lachnospiraceae bacterium]|nr:phosphoglycerate mutase family protein [Lachnospiraceae bacterium]
MRLLFVRHGEPDYMHDCLTETGKKQAAEVSEVLAKENISKIYASPMGRALETAVFTADKLGISKDDIEILDYMHELVWGNFDKEPYEDGHPWTISDDLVKEGWDLNDKSWPKHPYFKNNRVTECSFKTAEGIDRLLQSLGYVRNGMYYTNKREDDEQYTVALFSHGGSSSAAIAHILNLTFPYVCATFHSPFTGIVTIRFDKNPGSVCIPCLEFID